MFSVFFVQTVCVGNFLVFFPSIANLLASKSFHTLPSLNIVLRRERRISLLPKNILTLNFSVFCSLSRALHALVSPSAERKEIQWDEKFIAQTKRNFAFHPWSCSLMHYRHQSINVCLRQILLSEANGFGITLQDNDFGNKGFAFTWLEARNMLHLIGNRSRKVFNRFCLSHINEHLIYDWLTIVT